MQIERAQIGQLAELSRLFDLYRQFYACEPDLELATEFIRSRLTREESTIFIATEDQLRLSGFVQLYPTFCSVQAVRIFVLYDIYVDEPARHRGVGEKLMRAASEYARSNGAARIDLRTAFSNHPGQRLYERCGYVRVLDDFHTYSLQLA